jgi:D-alanyl-D-alanine carboxypeptidase (penicillin-binding protein 5/6)
MVERRFGRHDRSRLIARSRIAMLARPILFRLAAIHVALLSCLCLFSMAAAAFETKAKQAIMVDAASGTILFSKNADDQIPPASLAKMMTMETVFHAVGQGTAKLDDLYTVSENAWRTGGAPSGTATMFAALKSQIRLEDLVRGAIVQSANDGCIIIAEGMAGSEAKFVQLMNQRAAEIGLKGSVFKNTTGLPEAGQVVTMRDLVKLASHVWKTYPQFYPIYSQPDFTWNKITQRNRNPLLPMGIGADGMGTGFTEESGYAIVGSAARGSTRLFIAMGGMTTDKERAEEARKMMEWGFDGFRRTQLFADGAPIGSAKVFGGDKSRIALKAAGPITLLTPVDSEEKVFARIVYQGPVIAPVKTGTPVGSLNVRVGNTIVQETPLVAAEDVGVGSLHQRAFDAVEELALGWLRQL